MSEAFSRSWLASDKRNVSPAKVVSFLFISTQSDCTFRLKFARKV